MAVPGANFAGKRVGSKGLIVTGPGVLIIMHYFLNFKCNMNQMASLIEMIMAYLCYRAEHADCQKNSPNNVWCHKFSDEQFTFV